MKEILATDTQDARPQTKDDLTGDDLKQYEADIEAMNLILISIPNDIYNSVDACQNARDMWNRVKRLMQGTNLGEIERESRFVNEFDKFTAEAGESLLSNATTAMLKVTMHANVQSQEFEIITGVILSNKHNDFLLNVAAQMEELKKLSANICMMARIPKANSDSEDGPSYDSAFISE
nr:ribonuclease H-like domain-containing protein [Tanacetum cinerariifolium]